MTPRETRTQTPGQHVPQQIAQLRHPFCPHQSHIQFFSPHAASSKSTCMMTMIGVGIEWLGWGRDRDLARVAEQMFIMVPSEFAGLFLQRRELHGICLEIAPTHTHPESTFVSSFEVFSFSFAQPNVSTGSGAGGRPNSGRPWTHASATKSMCFLLRVTLAGCSRELCISAQMTNSGSLLCVDDSILPLFGCC